MTGEENHRTRYCCTQMSLISSIVSRVLLQNANEGWLVERTRSVVKHSRLHTQLCLATKRAFLQYFVQKRSLSLALFAKALGLGDRYADLCPINRDRAIFGFSAVA